MGRCDLCPVPPEIRCVFDTGSSPCPGIEAGDVHARREVVDRSLEKAVPQRADPDVPGFATSSPSPREGCELHRGDIRFDLIRACRHRTPNADERSDTSDISEHAACDAGRGTVPGLVTLRDCLDCAAGMGPAGREYPFHKDVLIRAALTSWTGYGQIGEWLGRGLESFGLGVGFADMGTDPRYLAPNPWVARRAVPAWADAPWSILLAPPYDPNPPGRVVRFTMWESSRISPAAARVLNAAELVCVPCEANRRWFVESGVTTRMALVPMGVSAGEGYRDDGTPPPRDVCRFGMAARMAHGGIRKGLNEGMEAFVAAFPPSVTDVELVLKVWPDCLARLRIPPDRRIRVVTTPMRPPEMAAWYRTLTALLVPSKGEGWGLHTHQAMAVGRPVIAVPWGGTTEFWDERCGWSLAYDLAPAGEFYTGQGQWAIPRREAMVASLRRVYADRVEAAAKGRAAAGRAAGFSWKRTARYLYWALVEAGLIRATGGVGVETGEEADGRDTRGPVDSRGRMSSVCGVGHGSAGKVEESLLEAAPVATGNLPGEDHDGTEASSVRAGDHDPAAEFWCDADIARIPIVIMTAPRAEPYLDRTLASLAPRRLITLMVGGPDAGYLRHYGGDPLIRIVVPSPGDYARVAGTAVHRHSAWNYWRCLGVGEGERRLLIFEDDVRFARGWEATLAATIGRVERHHADYVLSLYYPYPGEDDEGAGFVGYPKPKFYGTQGILFAGRALAGYRDYLRARGVEEWTIPYDWLLRDYTIERDIPLLAAMPSLVQHIGAVTTGQSDRFHTAPCFADDAGSRGADVEEAPILEGGREHRAAGGREAT
jgi:glycosyltransferase involved in cell wall biosynthesis